MNFINWMEKIKAKLKDEMSDKKNILITLQVACVLTTLSNPNHGVIHATGPFSTCRLPATRMI
ncbi:hypothetical protein IV04_24575 [Serratia sp. Ag1]|nr:hypothetical protein IV04_24575 [Serratia sp. Ag1]KFK92846.1 hypothetical protein JV45_19085 [Serratia sp. Ag2]